VKFALGMKGNAHAEPERLHLPPVVAISLYV